MAGFARRIAPAAKALMLAFICRSAPAEEVEAVFSYKGVEITAIGCCTVGKPESLKFWAKSFEPSFRLRPGNPPHDPEDPISLSLRNVNAKDLMIANPEQADKMCPISPRPAAERSLPSRSPSSIAWLSR